MNPATVPQHLIDLSAAASPNWTLPAKGRRIAAGVVLGDAVHEFARGSAQSQVACFNVPRIDVADERDPAVIQAANTEFAVACVQFVRDLIAGAAMEPPTPADVEEAFDEIDDCMRMDMKVVPTGALSVLRAYCARAARAETPSRNAANDVLANTLRQIIIECTESPNSDRARLETIESQARAGLERTGCPVAKPQEPKSWPEWTALRKKYVHLMAEMESRFKSGNSVPVERAHLTADEWKVWQDYDLADEHLVTSMALELTCPPAAVKDAERIDCLSEHDTLHISRRGQSGWSIFDENALLLARNCKTLRQAIDAMKGKKLPVDPEEGVAGEPSGADEVPQGTHGALVTLSGDAIQGTLESLSGVCKAASARRAADGSLEVEYAGAGGTEIFWDESKTVVRAGETIYLTEDGDEVPESQVKLVSL